MTRTTERSARLSAKQKRQRRILRCTHLEFSTAWGDGFKTVLFSRHCFGLRNPIAWFREPLVPRLEHRVAFVGDNTIRERWQHRKRRKEQYKPSKAPVWLVQSVAAHHAIFTYHKLRCQQTGFGFYGQPLEQFPQGPNCSQGPK